MEDSKNLSAQMPEGVEAIFYDEVTSTNDAALALASAGRAGPIWVGAAVQTAGRGRMGRTWVSKKGNLYTSLLIRPPEVVKDLYAVPYLTALAVRQALVKCGAPSQDISVKWPNDILCNQKKIAGILIESSIGIKNTVDHLVIGIGTNLTVYPDDVQFEATSFVKEFGHSIEPEKYFAKLAAAFDMQWRAWLQFGFASVRMDWLRCSWGIGEKRRVKTADFDLEGRLETLNESGALVFVSEDGSRRLIYAGDVFPL